MMRTTFICFLMFVFLQTFAQNSVFDVARNGSPSEMQELLNKDSKLADETNSRGFSPLILATYNTNNEVAKLLMEKSTTIDYNSPMGTALMAAIFKGNEEIAKELIKKGANINLQDANGNTALILATQLGNVQFVSLLLTEKADKTILNQEGKSAFEYAVFSGNQEIINLLK